MARVVTVYLKGDYARPGPHSGKDWDRGVGQRLRAEHQNVSDGQRGSNRGDRTLVNSVKAAFLLIGLIGAIGAYRNPDRAVWIDAMLVASIGFILVDWLTWSPRY
jgi:hypothetical protein